MPEWLIERGIGETRAALVDDDQIIGARIELDASVPVGSVIKARLASAGINGRNAVVRSEDGTEYLLPRGATGIAEGGTLNVEITRAAIPGAERWKLALGRPSDKAPQIVRPLAEIDGQLLVSPAPRDIFGDAGWDELIEQARHGVVHFAGGELRIAVTPAMTLIDVDGYLAPAELALKGASEAARAICRLDIGGSIGIDLPTVGNKGARAAAAEAIDRILPQPFERTAVNGFGFIQIVRPRMRASLLELTYDRPLFEARALLRRVGFEPAGAKTIVAHTAVVRVLEQRPGWVDRLSQQLGGVVRLRGDPSLPISGGYVEQS